ncbi:MAG: hypothetical protein VCF24_21540 [Candidatus Latescibacterota bacterium]
MHRHGLASSVTPWASARSPSDDGWLTSRWLTLDLPEILEASSQLATDEHNHRWAGEFGDRDITILLPRARAIWHS